MNPNLPRRKFLGTLLSAMAVPMLVEAAVSSTIDKQIDGEEPLPIPTPDTTRFKRAFAVRLEACCRQQGKTHADLARETGEILGRRIYPERLIPMCCEGTGWISLVQVVAEILHVPAGWLSFGEATATHPAPEWWVGAS